MQIRSFRKEDEEGVVEHWSLCGLVVSHNDPHRDIERKLKVNPEWFLVGVADEKIIGTCMAGYEGHRGWINYLAVHPEKQKAGHGAALVDHVESLLRKAGCPKINLQVRATNNAVIEFYESLGYEAEEIINMGKRLIPDEE